MSHKWAGVGVGNNCQITQSGEIKLFLLTLLIEGFSVLSCYSDGCLSFFFRLCPGHGLLVCASWEWHDWRQHWLPSVCILFTVGGSLDLNSTHFRSMEFSHRPMEWLYFLWQVIFIFKTITIPDFIREALGGIWQYLVLSQTHCARAVLAKTASYLNFRNSPVSSQK